MGKMEKTETGVMVMKNGMAWGTSRSDGHSTEHNWIDPVNAPIYDPKYCKRTTDVTYKGSGYAEELRTGKIVHVTRTVKVTVQP